MADASGSRPDVGYTFGYYRELSPGYIDFALTLAGLAAPERRGMSYLELGFGQGLSANIHAAACPGLYWGEDFNPHHAANAAAWATASGANANFTGDSFAELAARPGLPEFDYIVMHGIWSWVPSEACDVILDIVRRRLKPGGVVYVSYNAQPGFTEILPLRHITALVSGSDEARGDQEAAAAIDRAFEFANRLHQVGAAYFDAVPGAKRRLDAIGQMSRSHLAHDHFNPTWSPAYVSDVAKAFARANVEYAGSASLLDEIDELNLTPEQSALLAELPDVIERESVRDFMLHQSFRRDLFMHDVERLPADERGDRLARQRIALTLDPTSIRYDTPGQGDDVELPEALYAPIVNALATGEGAPKTIASLFSDPAVARMPPGLVLDAITVLVGSGRAHPAQEDDGIAVARPRCLALNAELARRARTSGDVRHLASSVTGAGLRVPRLEQLFLAARNEGADTPERWAESIDAVFAEQGLAVVRDGRPLEEPAAIREELTRLAYAFEADRLPLLQRLGVAE